MSPIKQIDREIKKTQEEYARQMAMIRLIEDKLARLRKERENADYLIRMGAECVLKRRGK